MKIKHFLYNSFIVEEGNVRIAIDPGKHLWLFKLNSLIPKNEWEGITHILVTHGDPDHCDYAVPMAEETGANVLCGQELADEFYSKNIKSVHPVFVGENVDATDVIVEGLKVEHGPLPVKLAGGFIEMRNATRRCTSGGQEVYIGPYRIHKLETKMDVRSHGTIKLLFGLIRLEKDNVPFATGAMGFHIKVEGKTIVNLGDSLLQKEWEGLKPDVLMIPIGGNAVGNTMDVTEALKAVEIIQPKFVIPVHYNVPFLWRRNINPTDDQHFQSEVKRMGIDCRIMDYGDQIEI